MKMLCDTVVLGGHFAQAAEIDFLYDLDSFFVVVADLVEMIQIIVPIVAIAPFRDAADTDALRRCLHPLLLAVVVQHVDHRNDCFYRQCFDGIVPMTRIRRQMHYCSRDNHCFDRIRVAKKAQFRTCLKYRKCSADQTTCAALSSLKSIE